MSNESKSAFLHEVLDQLLVALPEVRAAVVATTDGLSVAQRSLDGIDLSRLTALTATALGTGKQISKAVGNGAFLEWSVSGAAAHVYVYESGHKGILAVMTTPAINVPLLHQHARDAALAISLVL